MPPKSATKIAHDLLTLARDGGGSDATWENIFVSLRKTPEALKRPEPRKLNLLHQAAFWGKQAVCETLLAEFKADPEERTTDGNDHTAADVAAERGYDKVADFLRDPPKAAAKAKAKVKAKAKAAALGANDVAVAHKLLSMARDGGEDDVCWLDIFGLLEANPAAIERPEVRNYSLLHHAAYWGKKGVAERLIKEFAADPQALTGDGVDAAAVADSRGHGELATNFREPADGGGGAAAEEPPKKLLKKGSSSVGSSSDAAAADGGVDEAIAASAPSPYDPSKESNKAQAVDGVKGCVSVWLCLGGNVLSKDLKWQPYLAADQERIDNARLKGDSSLKLSGDRTVHFGAQPRQSSEGEKQRRRVSSFKVLWEWDSGEGGKAAPVWEAYPKMQQWVLEAAMCAADAVCELSFAPDKKYVVDLVGLRQYSAKDTFKCRRVRRRGVPLKEAFPPQVRDKKSGLWLNLSYRPDYWEAPDYGPGGDLLPKRHDLPMDSPAVKRITEWLNGTIRSGHAMAYGQVPGGGGPTKSMEVVRVEVVQAPALWRRYLCYRGQLESQKKEIKAHAGTAHMKKKPMAMPKCDWLDGDVNEAYFWHGSGKSSDGSIDLVDAIVSVGHEPSDENSEVMEVSDGASSRFAKNTSMFGAGVYLADLASKANLYVPCSICYQGAYFRDPCTCTYADCEKAAPYRMLLCRAVMGRIHVEEKYKEGKYKGDFNPAKKLNVDSVCGESKPGQLAFREYVVYHDSASYPEFIVHYRRRGGGFGGFGGGFGGGLFGGPPKKKGKFK